MGEYMNHSLILPKAVKKVYWSSSHIQVMGVRTPHVTKHTVIYFLKRPVLASQSGEGQHPVLTEIAHIVSIAVLTSHLLIRLQSNWRLNMFLGSKRSFLLNTKAREVSKVHWRQPHLHEYKYPHPRLLNIPEREGEHSEIPVCILNAKVNVFWIASFWKKHEASSRNWKWNYHRNQKFHFWVQNQENWKQGHEKILVRKYLHQHYSPLTKATQVSIFG